MFLGLKLLNVFGIACVGSAQLYLATFCDKALGLQPDIIGFIYSITPFVSCVAFPLWMSRIDKTKSYKKTMVTNMLIALMFFSSISLVPSLVQATQASERVAAALVSIGYFGYAFFGYPVIGVAVDSATLYVLGNRKQELYGKQKMGTPIGFGLSVFLTGVLMDAWGPYSIFVVFGTSVLGFVLTCLFTDFSPGYSSATATAAAAAVEPEDANKMMIAQKETSSARDLLAIPHAARFYLVMTLLGAVMGVMIAFLFLFVQKELHGTPAMVGLLGPLASCVEVVCFYFAKDIFRWLGPQKMILVTHGILIFRCLVYILATYLATSGALLATIIQPLHGLAYSLLWSAAVVEADTIAPAGLKARAQGLLGTVYLGLGAGLGTIVSGYVYNQFGANAMWSMLCALTTLSTAIYYYDKRITTGYLPISSQE